MNRLFETVFARIERERGGDSREACVLRELLFRCSLNAYEYIPVNVVLDLGASCGAIDESGLVAYFVEKLKLFDLHFRLYLDDDDHFDFDYQGLQLILNEGFFFLDGVRYDRSYIGSHVFVFLSPRGRFRRLLKELPL